MRDLLRFCEAEREWLLELVEALVELESPSDDKAAVDACGRELERRLRALGARVERLPRAEAGDLVAAEIGDGPRRVLLLGHLDTVWPVGQLAVMPYRREQGRIYGPGVYDMKAGVALGLLAVRALVETGRAGALRVAMLWTSDEEIGSRASRGAIEAAARRSRAVLVLEPALPGGALKTQRKACGEFEVVVHGRAAHAGLEPEQGASAIHELAEQILALERLNDVARGVTVNVGVVSGGSRANVVADEARALVDARAPTLDDAARLERAIRGLAPRRPGTRLEVRGGFERPLLERTEGVAELFALAREVARELGRDLAEGAAGGGSDGCFTAALGIPTLDGLGPVGDGAHAPHEHVLEGELPWRAALVAGLLARLAETASRPAGERRVGRSG